MFKSKELERINRQKIYDLNHYIDGVTIWDWKQKIIDDMFIVDSYYEKREKKKNGNSTIVVRTRCTENDDNAYWVEDIKINYSKANKKYYLILRAIESQAITYNEILPEQEIRIVCHEIILKAISKFKILDDCIKGKELERLIFYIVKCIKTETMNYINDYTETIRVKENGKEYVYSPEPMISLSTVIKNDENDDTVLTYYDVVSYENSIFNIKKDYKRSETLNLILKVMEERLSEEQQELLEILSITNDNNADAGRLLKKLDIDRGNKLRSSDEAYRVYVSREKGKIIKIVESEIDVDRINKALAIRDLKQSIEDFLDSDIGEKEVVDYTINNLNKYYIDEIVYNLETEQRQHLIINFINTYSDDHFDNEDTRKVCRYILEGLYNFIDELDNKIEKLHIVKDKPIKDVKETSTPATRKEYTGNQNGVCHYYIMKDKFEEFKQDKDIQIIGEKILIHDKGKDYNHEKEIFDCYYIGEYVGTKKERKTQYGKTNAAGLRYLV